MSIKYEMDEIEAIIERLLDNLSLSISSQTGHEGMAMRHQIGRVRAAFDSMLYEGEFGTELLDCFTKAYEAKVKLPALFHVHEQLFAEDPSGEIATMIVQSAVAFCLATESRLITEMTFTSRDDVEAMIRKMKTAFDTARELAADAQDSSTYQKLTYLAGALTQHLATTARPLPRMIKFAVAVPLPALSLANRLYYDPARWNELVDENKIIHPLFCGQEIVGLAR